MGRSTLLFGSTSILGFELANQFADRLLPFSSPGNSSPTVQHWPTLQLENSRWITTTVKQWCPETILYTHAVCDVPKCEADPEWAFEINVQHVGRLLQTLPDHVRLVYVSSDHVFGGDGTYDEDSHPCPISQYGQTRVRAEQLVLNRPGSLVIRVGLSIGPSPDGKTGHRDWLRYRIQRKLPITIVLDEYRSTVWAKDLAERVWALAQSQEVGLRHVPCTRAISRVELAKFLCATYGLKENFRQESRTQRPYPHLGRVELASSYTSPLSQPLASILDVEATSG